MHHLESFRIIYKHFTQHMRKFPCTINCTSDYTFGLFTALITMALALISNCKRIARRAVVHCAGAMATYWILFDCYFFTSLLFFAKIWLAWQAGIFLPKNSSNIQFSCSWILIQQDKPTCCTIFMTGSYGRNELSLKTKRGLKEI
jgi:hypothetical protein